MAVIENAANYKDVFSLSLAISEGEESIANFPFEKFATAQFGEIEQSFAVFQKEYHYQPTKIKTGQ